MPDSDNEKIHWAVDAIKNLGVPTAILCVLTYGIWQAAGWTGENVLKPLVQHQTKMMESLSESSKQQADALGKIQQSISNQEEILEKLSHEPQN